MNLLAIFANRQRKKALLFPIVPHRNLCVCVVLQRRTITPQNWGRNSKEDQLQSQSQSRRDSFCKSLNIPSCLQSRVTHAAFFLLVSNPRLNLP